MSNRKHLFTIGFHGYAPYDVGLDRETLLNGTSPTYLTGWAYFNNDGLKEVVIEETPGREILAEQQRLVAVNRALAEIAARYPQEAQKNWGAVDAVPIRFACR